MCVVRSALKIKRIITATLLATGLISTTHAESSKILSQVNVIGDPAAIYEIPGSAHYIDYSEIREFSYDDINRVLRHVPGVYIREEDGYGLFPNISLRGVDSSRSAKVTLMEDGILAAPAPYAAPSAYYSPTTGRMSGLEVLKGTSQVKYGPHTTGGAINYLSTPIPFTERTYLRGQYGEDNEYRTHAFHGNTVDTEYGRFGYLAEFYLRSTDGFKTIDSAPDFNDTNDTGFYNIEPMFKLAWEPETPVYQRFEIKYGHTDKVADETYLGLSTSDFRADPFRRYSASRFDEISTEHHRSYARHFISPTDNLDIVTTAYYNKFRRNWYKLGSTSEGNLSSALASGGTALDCLRGMAACDLIVRANNRAYEAWGVQSEGTLRFSSGALNHELNIGVRYHEDEEDRFQHEDTYTQDGSGAITGFTPGAPGSQANRVDSADAVALFVRDRIELGNWWFTPGFRHEWIDYERLNRDTGISTSEYLTVMGGGIGGGYNFTEEWQGFGGIHFGFSPPGPGGAISGLEEETSIGYEAGVRYNNRRGILAAEAVGFLTRFEDLIVVDNIGGTGSGDTENFGEVDAYGVELSGEFDPGRANGWTFSNPYFLTYTYTNAEQQNDSTSTDAESIFSFGREGNKVPYIPEHQLTVGSSLEFARWGASVTAIFVDETFTSANNVSAEVNGDGDPDARFGKTDSYTVVDIAAHYNIKNNIKVFGGVHNLFEEEYIVSRQPHGPRPGAPRLWFVGLEMDL